MRRATTTFILITVILEMLALGVIIPVLPKLILEFASGDSARAAFFVGVFGSVWALMHFLCSPVLGALSDRFGRRPVILLANAGLGLDYVLMALAPNLWWLLVGRIVSGVTAASIGTAHAYVADITAPERRAEAFGLIGVGFGLGFILGPALGGLLGDVNPRLPFWVAGGLSLLNALYGVFVLPESLPKERRSRLQLRKANPIGALQLLNSHPQLLGLAGVSLIANLAHVALPSTFVLYADYRYGWSQSMIGIALAVVGVFAAVVQGGLVGPAVHRFGERATLIVGLICGVAAFAVFGLATTGGWFWAGMPIMAFWGLAGPAAQSLMTRLVGPNVQGKLQGARSSLMGVAELSGPLLFTQTFAYFIATERDVQMPGAPFLLASILLAGALILATIVTRKTTGPATVS
jgi:DHA1 family tetracycline resistance protein-like MFS transporter